MLWESQEGFRVDNQFGSSKSEARSQKFQNRISMEDQSAENIDNSLCESEFMKAMNEYKDRNGRMFPTWSEVLEVLQSLGYRKVVED